MTRKEWRRRAVRIFARRIRARRIRLGLTQREAADLGGIPPAQLSRYEAGRRKPCAANLAKLAIALRLSEAALARMLAPPPPRRQQKS